MADDVEKLNSSTERKKSVAGSALSYLAERRATLTQLVIQDHLALYGADEIEVPLEPLPSLHIHRLSHVSRTISRRDSTSKKTYLDFEHGDPENPLNFSTLKKYFITCLVLIVVLLCSAATGAYGPVIPNLVEEFGVSVEVATLGISMYPVGSALGGMVIAPVSEIHGRNPVYFINFFIYALLFIPQALCQSIETMLICRFLGGVASSAGAGMVGGTIADLFETKDRGRAMTTFGVAAVVGMGLGPLVAGFIYTNPHLGWRWIFWIQLIASLFWLVIILIFLPETRASVILRRRVDKLKAQTGDLTLVAVGDESRLPFKTLVRISTTRPFLLLLTEQIVLWFTLWVSFAWGILYLFFNTVGQVFDQVYGFSPDQIGLGFLPVIIGGILGGLLSPIQDYLYARAERRNLGKPRPEARLYSSCVGSLMFASGLFWFGWSSRPDVHWIWPILAVGWSTIGIYSIYTAVFNYLADSYTIYASSALAGAALLRNLSGCGFPLFSLQMNNRLGINWSMSLVGFIGFALSAIPYVLIVYGPQIREKSRFSKKVLAMGRTK